MKNILLSLIICLIGTATKAQITATVKDPTDQKPIPYVNIWVENENIGVTADENGKFTISAPVNSKLVFNALGYEIKSIISSTINDVVYLSPKIFELNEIKVYPKNIEELKFGTFPSDSINSSISMGEALIPLMIARYFKYDTTINKTPYLKSLKILTKSRINNSLFKIRLYNSSENGVPDKEILNENIFANAIKGKSNTIIDLTNYNITFPEQGIFIVLESLIIKENKYEYDFYPDIKNRKIKERRISYEPSFCARFTSKDLGDTWTYRKGNWIQMSTISRPPGLPQPPKYNLLAIELTLTN